MTHSLDPFPTLLPTVEAFLDRTGMSPSRFGELCCNDRTFVADLRAGDRELRRGTIEKVVKWIEGYEAGKADAVRAA